jgi:hypothetical protein
MLKKAPHILITTPESLAIMISSIKFREHLKAVEWLVVDEIHALAENKRGVHLSLTLERMNKIESEKLLQRLVALRLKFLPLGFEGPAWKSAIEKLLQFHAQTFATVKGWTTAPADLEKVERDLPQLERQLQDAFNARNVLLVPFDLQAVVQQLNGHVIAILKHTDILVTGAEEGFNPAADPDTGLGPQTSFVTSMDWKQKVVRICRQGTRLPPYCCRAPSRARRWVHPPRV